MFRSSSRAFQHAVSGRARDREIILPAMRKLLLSVLLPFMLLLSQQGAVLHEIGHIADLTQSGAGAPGSKSHPAGDLQCETCLAFAHLAGVATVHVPVPPLLALEHPRPSVDAPVFVGADAPTARSRGPPLVL